MTSARRHGLPYGKPGRDAVRGCPGPVRNVSQPNAAAVPGPGSTRFGGSACPEPVLRIVNSIISLRDLRITRLGYGMADYAETVSYAACVVRIGCGAGSSGATRADDAESLPDRAGIGRPLPSIRASRTGRPGHPLPASFRGLLPGVWSGFRMSGHRSARIVTCRSGGSAAPGRAAGFRMRRRRAGSGPASWDTTCGGCFPAGRTDGWGSGAS